MSGKRWARLQGDSLEAGCAAFWQRTSLDTTRLATAVTLMKSHLINLIVVIIFAVPTVAAADDLLAICLNKYKLMEGQFELYNQKSALVNGIMDRINVYAKADVDITTIKVQDAKAWRAALEQSVPVGQLLLQNTMEYGVTCSSGPVQKKQLDEMIAKLTVDQRIARARISALDTGFPTSSFK